MICPITDRECKTNGCGTKCYKRDTLGHKPEHTNTAEYFLQQKSKEIALVCCILREHEVIHGTLFETFDKIYTVANAWIEEYGVGTWGTDEMESSDPRTDMEFDEAVVDFAEHYLLAEL